MEFKNLKINKMGNIALKISKMGAVARLEFPQGGEIAVFPVNDSLSEPLSIPLNPGDYVLIRFYEESNICQLIVHRKTGNKYKPESSLWFQAISYIDAGNHTIEGEELEELVKMLESEK